MTIEFIIGILYGLLVIFGISVATAPFPRIAKHTANLGGLCLMLALVIMLVLIGILAGRVQTFHAKITRRTADACYVEVDGKEIEVTPMNDGDNWVLIRHAKRFYHGIDFGTNPKTTYIKQVF